MAYLRELHTQWLRFPRVIKLFYGSDIFFGLAMALFNTLFNLHLLQVGFTANHIGVLQSISSWIMVAIAIPVGLAGDRWGPRGLYVAGSLMFGVPYMLMPWLTNFPLLVVVYTVNTLGTTLMMVNESPLLAGEVGPDLRASVFSFMTVNFFLWTTLGTQLAGFLADWLPAGGLSKFQWPLLIAGVFGITSGVWRALLPFRPHPPARQGLNLRPSRHTLRIALINLLVGVFMALILNFNNVILAERYNLDVSTISTILTIAGIAGWAGALMVPWTSRKFGDLRAYGWVVGLQGIALIWMGFAGTTPLFLGGFWTRALFGTMQASLFNSFAMGSTPPEERATVSSYGFVGRNLGSALAVQGYGVAIASGSFLLPFTVAGLFAIGAAVVTLSIFHKHTMVGTDASGLH